MTNLEIEHLIASAKLFQLWQSTNKLDMRENSSLLIKWHLLEHAIKEKDKQFRLDEKYPLEPVREKFSEFFNS